MNNKYKLQKINKYLLNKEYSFLLYSLFYQKLNQKIKQGKNIIIFQFNSLDSILYWLQNSITLNSTNKYNIISKNYNEIIQNINDKNKYFVNLCKNNINRFCIIISFLDLKKNEYQLSAYCFPRIENQRIFEDIKKRYQKHCESFSVLEKM